MLYLKQAAFVQGQVLFFDEVINLLLALVLKGLVVGDNLDNEPLELWDVVREVVGNVLQNTLHGPLDWSRRLNGSLPD